MGLIGQMMTLIFGGKRNAVVETVEVFRENAEKAAVRGTDQHAAALAQFAAEFDRSGRNGFDRFVDRLNRLPRPLLALGTIALFVAAMVDPAWFGSRMVGVALVPEPLWWLMGAIVSFYFGARYQVKGQEFQASIAKAVTTARPVPMAAQHAAADPDVSDNAALLDWQAQNGSN